MINCTVQRVNESLNTLGWMLKKKNSSFFLPNLYQYNPEGNHILIFRFRFNFKIKYNQVLKS